MLILLAALLLFPVIAPTTPSTGEPSYLYRVTLVRATPGEYRTVLAHFKDEQARLAAAGEPTSFTMRHTQGDHWDVMVIYPMESYAAYFTPERIAARTQAHAGWAEKNTDLVAWQEDLFVMGPSLDEVQQRFEGMAFYHVEMFEALPGKHAELYHQREMENRYLAALDRPQNLIFVRSHGGSTDLFTLGFYRDLKHFAESADISLEDEDRAAKSAGFDDVWAISPYLRSLISRHHDTLAVAYD